MAYPKGVLPQVGDEIRTCFFSKSLNRDKICTKDKHRGSDPSCLVKRKVLSVMVLPSTDLLSTIHMVIIKSDKSDMVALDTLMVPEMFIYLLDRPQAVQEKVKQQEKDKVDDVHLTKPISRLFSIEGDDD